MISRFQNLTPVIQWAILNFNTLREQRVVRRVNPYFFDLVQRDQLCGAWRKKLQDFFPDDYVRIRESNREKQLIWYLEYTRIYSRHYAHLKQTLYESCRFAFKPDEVFQLFKQGNKVLKELNFSLRYLILQDRDGFNPAYWGHRNNHQAILDHFYRLAVDRGGCPLYWAVALFQEEEVLRAALVKDPTALFRRIDNPLEYAAKINNERAYVFLGENYPIPARKRLSAWREGLHAGHIEMASRSIPANQQEYFNRYKKMKEGQRTFQKSIEHLDSSVLKTKAEAVLDADSVTFVSEKEGLWGWNTVGRNPHDEQAVSQFLNDSNSLLTEPTPEHLQESRRSLESQVWKKRKLYLAGFVFIVVPIVLCILAGLEIIPAFVAGIAMFVPVCGFTDYFFEDSIGIQEATQRKLADFLNNLERIGSVSGIATALSLEDQEALYQHTLNDLYQQLRTFPQATNKKIEDFLQKGKAIAEFIEAQKKYNSTTEPTVFFTEILKQTHELACDPTQHAKYKKLADLVDGAPEWRKKLRGLMLVFLGAAIVVAGMYAVVASGGTVALVGGIVLGSAGMLRGLSIFDSGKRRGLSQKMVEAAQSAKKLCI